MQSGTGDVAGWKARARSALVDARRRTLRLLEGLPEAELARQHSPLMSPLVWDLAHIGNYEEQWLLRALGEPGLTGPDVDLLYDAFRHPRATRSALPLLPPDRAFRYVAQVRERVLAFLDRLEPAELLERLGPTRRPGPCEPVGSPGPGGAVDPARLLAGGFVFGMVAQHEQQHAETLCATLQLMEAPHHPRAPPAPRADPVERRAIRVPGGAFWMGSDDAWAYDNERPRHRVEVPEFLIDSYPVTNADYQRFIEEGGYDDPRLWTEAGWSHRVSEGLTAPLFWKREGTGWLRRRFGMIEEVPPDEPIQHVCWYEADAFARWAGKRLPTEAEWEKAASHPGGAPGDDAGGDAPRAYPWGAPPVTQAHANLGQRHLGPSCVGAHPLGRSALGILGLLGDVWEWTASDFGPYPGFDAFPYREYSEVFFGPDYKVLRGGSWASAAVAVRNSFRNWDFPIRRQIFAGFRCAQDA